MRARSWILPPLLAVAVVCLGGCGSSSPAPTTGSSQGAPAPAKQVTTPLGAPGSVTAGAGGVVPLGISPADLEEKLGSPAGWLTPIKGGYRCVLYRMAEEPPFVKLRYCFRHDRLKFFSTYAVDGR
jgi:hypothetical protein